MFALKLAQASGLKILLSSSSNEKIENIRKKFKNTKIQGINYRTNPNWHEDVLKATGGAGVDLVVENGGSTSLVESIKCTRRGGVVSQVGYLGGQDPMNLKQFVSSIIDRRVNVR